MTGFKIYVYCSINVTSKQTLLKLWSNTIAINKYAIIDKHKIEFILGHRCYHRYINDTYKKNVI